MANGRDGFPLSLDEIDCKIKFCEHQRLRYMHCAPLYIAFSRHLIPDPWVQNRGERERSKFLSRTLMCNLELNDLCRLRNKATVRNARYAVVYLARKHPAFRSMETFRPGEDKIVGVMGIIYDYAKVPSYPDTGPQPTVRELFASRDPEDTTNPRYIELIIRHYNQVLPGVEF